MVLVGKSPLRLGVKSYVTCTLTPFKSMMQMVETYASGAEKLQNKNSVLQIMEAIHEVHEFVTRKKLYWRLWRALAHLRIKPVPPAMLHYGLLWALVGF